MIARWLGRKLINIGIILLHYDNDLRKKQNRVIMSEKGYTWKEARRIGAGSSKKL